MNSVSADHIVFQNNPLQLQSFVDKYAEVTTITGDKLQGKIYTIDPVSETVVLISHTVKEGCSETSLNVDMIIGHSLKSIDLIQPQDNSVEIPDGLFDFSWKDKFTQGEIVNRRKTVKEWLCTNRLPVEEDGEVLRLVNALEILPPYDSTSCSSLDGNEIILGRVQDLIKSMPVPYFT